MLKEQKRSESKIMIRGIITLIVLLLKHIFDYDVPIEIVDTVLELSLTGYGMYAIGNSPRIKGEY